MIPITDPEYWVRWMYHQSQGQDLEAWRGVMCVLRWLAIRERNNIPPAGRVFQLEDDIVHSKLLRRLIEGKEPLPDPPPDSFGNPWYELGETGESEAVEVQEILWAEQHYVLINQSIWKVVERVSEIERRVQYQDQTTIYRLTQTDDRRWRLQREGTPL